MASRAGEDSTNLEAELESIAADYADDPSFRHEHLTAHEVAVILAMIGVLNSFEQKWVDHEKLIEKLNYQRDPNQDILSCACCGEQYATQTDGTPRKLEHTFVEVPLHDLSMLLLTPDESTEYFNQNFDYRQMRSIYPPAQTNPGTPLWHLHPEAVINDNVTTASQPETAIPQHGSSRAGAVTPPVQEPGEHTPPSGVPATPLGSGCEKHLATLCTACNTSILKKETMPQYAVAIEDYCSIERIPDHAARFPPLAIGECMAISRARPYGIILKLSALIAGSNNRMSLASHLITMPFGGANVLADNFFQTLPLTQTQMADVFKVVFVGAQNFRVTRSAMLAGLSHAFIRKSVCKERLLLYKAMNPKVYDESVHIHPNLDSSSDYANSPEDLLPAALREKLPAGVGKDNARPVPPDVANSGAIVINGAISVRLNRLACETDGQDIAGVRDTTVEECSDSVFEPDVGCSSDVVDGAEMSNMFPLMPGGHDVKEGHESASSATTDMWTNRSLPTAASLLISADGSDIDHATATNLAMRELRSISLTMKGAEEDSKSENKAAPVSSLFDEYVAPDPREHSEGKTQSVHTTGGGADSPHPRPEQSAHQPQRSEIHFDERPGDRVPYNEYEETWKILCYSFPELWLLGQCKGTGAKTPNENYIQHLNNQRDPKFRKNKELQFLWFNRMQRFKAAEVVARKVRDHPASTKRAAELFNSEPWKAKLAAATRNPTSKEATEVLNDVQPLLQGMANKIPHSASERAEVLTYLHAMCQRFGPSTSFLTFAPDDTNDIILLRMCIGSISNSQFPSKGSIQYENNTISFKDLLDGIVTVDEATRVELKIPLTQNQKVHMTSLDPVSVARLYIFMQKCLFHDLLGIAIGGSSTKKTFPRADTSVSGDHLSTALKSKYKDLMGDHINITQPPLGQALDALAVTEEQKNLTLHTHAVAVTTLKPEILQLAGGHAYLQERVCRIIGSIYKAELPLAVHLKHALCHGSQRLPKPKMSRQLPPTSVVVTMGQEGGSTTDEKAVVRFAEQCVMTTQIHSHNHPGACTPKKKKDYEGPLHCRLAKGTPLSASTSVMELLEPEVIEEDHQDPNERSATGLFDRYVPPEKETPAVDNTVPAVRTAPISARNPNTYYSNRLTGEDSIGLVPQDARAMMYTLRRPRLLQGRRTPTTGQASPQERDAATVQEQHVRPLCHKTMSTRNTIYNTIKYNESNITTSGSAASNGPRKAYCRWLHAG